MFVPLFLVQKVREDIEDFGETHLDFLSNMVILMVFLFTIPLPELYPVSVLQNFTSALLTGCVTAIHQMTKTSSRLMEKHFHTPMIKVVSGAGFRSHTPTLPGPKHNPHSPQPKLIRILPCRKLFSIFPQCHHRQLRINARCLMRVGSSEYPRLVD